MIIVASVSCIYGIGNPEEFKKSVISLKKGEVISRNKLLLQFVENLYSRSDETFERGNFRVRGDTVDLYLAYTDYAIRFEFWGDEIESISTINPETGKEIEVLEDILIYPANLFVSSPENTQEGLMIRIGLNTLNHFFNSLRLVSCRLIFRNEFKLHCTQK